MKTLKKTLCLVLAVVMVVGVLVLPANAATTTAADADAETAFKTLFGYGVMNGVDANNTPALSKNINRQEMAAIIYRVMTGDTTDKYVANYAGSANEFADSATFDAWAKGYIGYAGSKGIFKGDNNGNFKPKEEIKGDDVLTVLLRCIGYGQNGEFTGANYAANAKAQAADINLFGGAKDYVNVPEDMSKVINRGTVAKLTYNAIQAPMAVVYNGTYSVYQDNQGRPAAPNTGATLNPPLVEYKTNKGDAQFDKWGIPYYEYIPTIKFNSSYNAKPVELAKVVEQVEPLGEYWTAITQCDLSEDLGLKAETTFNVCVNGKDNKTTIKVAPTNTVAQIGAQGRHTLVYDLVKDDKNTPDTIVYIDTLLAEVTNVVAPTFDARGHIKTPAKLDMTVYTNRTGVAVTQTKTDGTSYAYAKGDMLLVNYIQNGLDKTGAYVDVSGNSAEAQDIKPDADTTGTAAVKKGVNVKIVDRATAFDGKQTTIYYTSSEKHTIDNVDYNDNNRFHLDQAKTNAGTYTWYMDNSPEGKNLIGSKLIKSEASFGVITRIWAEIANGTTAVKANVTYADGRTATLDVGTIITDKIDSDDHVAAGTGVTAVTNLHWGPATYLNASSKEPMAYDESTAGTASDAFYVSNSYEENLAADKVIGSSSKTNHIIGANLFKIVASGSKYNFIEVIGGSTNADLSADAPYVDYTGMGNASTAMVPSKVANDTVVANDNTRYLIKTGGAGTDANPFTFETKVGYTNIVEYIEGEVDYADVDGDGYADIVYITAAPKAASGDHIFFSEAVLKTDKGVDTWELNYSYDISSKIYTVYGWLDGVYGAVQVKNNGGTVTDSLGTTAFNAFVTDATGNQLWLVTVTDGLVKDIDGKRSDNTAVNATVGSNLFGSGTNALDDGTYGMNTPGAYTGMKLFVYTSAGTPKTEEVNGTTLKLGDGKYFNIATLKDKPTVGDWADVLVKDTVVYVVYNGANVVTQAYVVSLADGSGYTTPTTSTCDIALSAVSATFENSSHTLTINFTLTNGTTTMVGVDQTKVKVSGKIQSQALGTGEWSDLGTFTDLSPAGAIASGSATSVTSTTAWSGNLNTNQNYRVVYTITFDGDTVGTADTPAGVAVS